MPASQRALRPDAEAAAAEQELQTLSYAVSHDLSASVRHMTAFARLFVEGLAEDQAPKQRLFAEQLRQSAERCTAMLEQLLIYSRLQQRELKRSLHDPTPALREAWSRLAANAEAADADLTIEPLGAVYADADLLVLGLAALLDNAIKFRRPGVEGKVIIRPAHDRAFWRVRVQDNGVGVERALREAAFAMFRRLNCADAYAGVGAGLAICRRIARRHGGEARFLDCEEGACVEFAVPRPRGRAARRAGSH